MDLTVSDYLTILWQNREKYIYCQSQSSIFCLNYINYRLHSEVKFLFENIANSLVIYSIIYYMHIYNTLPRIITVLPIDLVVCTFAF
jgi:hypothetical protein